MKKIITIVAVFLISITLKTVSAETFVDYLPGGKNYLDPANFELSGKNVYTKDSIRVKSNQTYTLSFPDNTTLGDDIVVVVEGLNVHIDEAAPLENCIDSNLQIVCTFTTSETEEYIDIQISSMMMDLFYTHYNIEGFMLEEGNIVSDYEEYIPPYIDSTSPLFQGTGVYIKSYQTNESIVDIIDQHIIAFDEIDGDISNQIVIENDEYSGNEYMVGEYLVELSVNDAAGNVTTFDLYVFVKDEIAPLITSDDTIYLDVDDELLLSEVLSNYVSYTDEYDDAPILTVTADSYTGNESQVGLYNISLEVEDSSNNKTTKDISIEVKDMTSPVLQSTDIFEVDVDSPLYTSNLISLLEVSDNYDSSVDITIIDDGYIGHESITGTYFVDVELSDDSLNITPITLTIHVSDNYAPVIKGPSQLTISYTEDMSIETLKEMFLVTDNYDSLSYYDLVLILNDYSENNSLPGDYTIEFEVSDSSGNISTHSVSISVIDDISPIIYIDSYIVVVEVGSTFKENDMMKLLRMSDSFNDNQYDVVTLIDEYTGNENVVGDYSYKVKLIDLEGEEFIKEFVIQVTEDDSQAPYLRPIIFTSIGVIICVGAVIYRKFK